MDLAKLKNPPDWMYHLAVCIPPLIFLLLLAFLPDPAGFDGRIYKASQLITELDQKTDDIYAVLSLPDVQWQSLAARHHHGVIGASRPVWYRLTIPPRPAAESLTAEISYHLLRKGDLYLVKGGQVLASKFGGTERPTDPVSPFCRLTFRADQTQEMSLFVRLETDVTVVAPLFVGPKLAFDRFENLRRWVHSLIAGLVMGFVIYKIATWITLRQRIYGNLVMSGIGALLFPTIFSGQILYIWPNFRNDLAFQILVLCELILISQFFLLLTNRRLIARDTGKNSISWVEGSVMIMTASLVLLSPIFSMSLALLVLVCFSNIITMAVLLLSSMRWPAQNMLYYRTFLSTFISSEIICTGSWLGWVPASFFGHYAVNFGLVVGALLLSMAMTYRIRRLELKHRDIVKSLRIRKTKSANAIMPPVESMAFSGTREIDVTIMYVDIVSFSVIADQMQGQGVFSDLSRRLASLTKIIDDHDGVVDRSLGDALLCFFATKPGRQSSHAIEAFRAADEIQRMLVSDAKRIKNSGDHALESLLPVRIGLHSDRVLLANLGGGLRVDFTMVGQGVNFVSSLEQACAPFNIMISKNCRDKLVADGLKEDLFDSVMVSMKHHKDLIKAFEYNPTRSRPDDLKVALSIYYSQVEIHPRHVRHMVASGDGVRLRSQGVEFSLLDYSPNGMRLLSQVYFAQKVVLEFDLELLKPDAAATLRGKMLDKLIAEVRWSRKTDLGYEHGIKLLGGNRTQLDLLLEIFAELPGAGVTAKVS